MFILSTLIFIVYLIIPWNDAADAASAVVEHIAASYPTEVLFNLDGDDYYDYQSVRPRVVRQAAGREIVWPKTMLRRTRLPDRDLILLSGPEPNLRWRQYCAAVISALRSQEPELVVLLGAMLTDSPHSRPLPVTGNSTDAGLARALGLDPTNYEGPTGITGVLADGCRRAGLRAISLWVSVPHYVAAPPNPKAVLALLSHVEDLLDIALELGDLPAQAQAWQRGIDELATEDADFSEYVGQLEAQQDEGELPETTGDRLAAEFQRYLRRRDDQA